MYSSTANRLSHYPDDEYGTYIVLQREKKKVTVSLKYGAVIYPIFGDITEEKNVPICPYE